MKIQRSIYLFQEAAIDTAGPVDDGTESIGDVPSLSEEVAGYLVNPVLACHLIRHS